ncbi:MAG: LEPR-XLL domain-containing protein [Planctomycetaceae bacterium]|nr:LEPR-XLL domain-containing protein [Planctomycetaceae bacterium]
MIRWLRRSRLEKLEPRVVFNADPVASKPLWVGGVYVEQDSGTDAHGDSFYVTFEGGVANTKLTKLVINTDQNTPGYSVADNLFDTIDADRGADHAFGFKIESLEAKDPNARVWADVLDGSMQLVLNFENFYAGDRLVFSIDVDVRVRNSRVRRSAPSLARRTMKTQMLRVALPTATTPNSIRPNKPDRN